VEGVILCIPGVNDYSANSNQITSQRALLSSSEQSGPVLTLISTEMGQAPVWWNAAPSTSTLFSQIQTHASCANPMEFWPHPTMGLASLVPWVMETKIQQVYLVLRHDVREDFET